MTQNVINEQELYAGLIALTLEDNTPFFFEDSIVNEEFAYRVFNYKLAKYSDFLKPYANYCRGTMFLVNRATNQMIELSVLPMPKFHTYGESQWTMDIDFKDAKNCFLKLDGSLISTFIDKTLDNQIGFKSKKHHFNKALNSLIEKSMNEKFKEELTELTLTHTVDCELTTPENRVIIEYTDYCLYVLKARSRSTGEFLDMYTPEFEEQFPEIYSHLAPKMDLSILQHLDYKHNILDIPDIEGVVVEFNDGSMTKVKTRFYLSHSRFANIQDFKNYNNFLVKAVLEENVDNLRTLFNYRNRSENFPIDEILAKIDSVEEQVLETFRPFEKEIMSFYDQHKDLDKPDFIKVAKEQKMVQHMAFYSQLLDNSPHANIKDYYFNKIGRHIKYNI